MQHKAVSIREVVQFNDSKFQVKPVFESSNFKAMALAFRKGQELSEHMTPTDALLIALEGEAVLLIEKQEVALSAGDAFRIPKNIPHSLKAKGDFRMVLMK